MPADVVIVNYHKGNLSSVARALEDAGARATISDEPSRIAKADALVLPGVGSFEDAMDFMDTSGESEALREALASGMPFLGICLGQHLLLDCGYETDSGEARAGLGYLRGHAKKLEATAPLKIPHVGWDQIELTDVGKNCPILDGIASGSNFYFTHSYIPAAVEEPYCAATTSYGEFFPSVIWKDKCFAVQFHPEKSSRQGLRMLQNFVHFIKASS